MDDYEPTTAPRSDARCWPFPCRDWHETTVHLDGSEPCECPCHDLVDGKAAAE